MAHLNSLNQENSESSKIDMEETRSKAIVKYLLAQGRLGILEAE